MENKNAVNECNKCNDNKCNDNKCNDNKCNNDNYDCNPFDFNAIYDHYDQHHYWDNNVNVHDDDECPALDLIANHYADFVPDAVAGAAVAGAVSDASDDVADDDDRFELIQIESFRDFPLPK